ncbi:MAG: DUF4494 domain-containing protein [Marinilabiliales bacterium]|nr:DUF4494 domain-containing protein [Marinilabiliales bacterium]
MNTWFECTAKYSKMDENGREKKVSETYLLDAVSFTEAETRIYKELATMVTGEFTVSRIARTKLSEIIPAEIGDRWYKAKVTFITFDEESGKEKRISQFVLVFSDNVKSAYDQVIEAMKGMMADFEIGGITESPIVDVFPYVPEAQKIPENLTKISGGDFAIAPSDFEDETIEEEDYPEV